MNRGTLKFTEIKLSGLAEGTHSFAFQLDSHFLEPFSQDFFSNPVLSVSIRLLLAETMIKADVSIEGKVTLICDRSLDEFDSPVSLQIIHFFKFGEEEVELSDELDVISKDKLELNFDQLIYDSVALSVPGKKLHPRFRENEEESENFEGEIIFSTHQDTSPVENEESIDPRWAKLKELNS